MIGKTLALVQRAFRVDARDWRSHAFRAALAGFILWVLATSQINQFSFSAPGRSLFGTVVWLNYWFITVAGATFFASAITEEKEERTLSLLKMADIGPLAILMGKWLPRLTGAMFLVLVQIPFTALAVTLGGILWHQIVASYASLLAHLIVIGSLGLLASVYFSRTSYAVTTMAIFLVAYHIGPYLVKEITQEIGLTSTLGVLFEDVTVWLCERLINARSDQQLSEALSVGFQFSASSASWSSGLLYQILSNVIAGAIFFGISWLIFEPCTRNEVEPGGESVWWNRLRHMGRKGSQRRVWSWPVVWKDFYYVAGGPTTNILKFIAYLVFLGLFLLLIAYGPGGIDAEEVGAVFIWWSVVFLVIESAILVTRVYRDELQKQTWPTLTLVPLSIPELAYHKLAGALLALIPAGLCLGFGLLCVLEDVVDGLGELLSEPVALFSVSYFLLQMALGYHLATWLSIVAKWAIWPLAIFVSGLIVIMGNIMLMRCLAFAMFGGGDSWAGFMVILSMVSFGAVITMHILIGRKLAELAYAE